MLRSWVMISAVANRRILASVEVSESDRLSVCLDDSLSSRRERVEGAASFEPRRRREVLAVGQAGTQVVEPHIGRGSIALTVADVESRRDMRDSGGVRRVVLVEDVAVVANIGTQAACSSVLSPSLAPTGPLRGLIP